VDRYSVGMKIDSLAPPTLGLVDDEEMADITCLTTAAINKLRKQKIIPYLKIGGAIRFEPAEVLAALHARFEVREGEEAST
jgi:hypothetical protein